MKDVSKPRMGGVGVMIFGFLALSGGLLFSLLGPPRSGGPAPQPGQGGPLAPTATVAAPPPLTPPTAPAVEWPPTPYAFTPLPAPMITAIPPSLPIPFQRIGSSDVPISTPLPTIPPPAETTTPSPGHESGAHDFGAWGYTYEAIPDDGDLIPTVRYDAQSLAGIQAYVQANQALAADLAQQGGGVRVDITFRNYVGPEQFRDWMRRRALFAAWSGLRVLDVQDVRADLEIPWSLADPLPQPTLDHWLAADQGYRLRGVFYVNALVDAQQLPALIADPLVYLVDVTPNIVQRELYPRYHEIARYSLQNIRVFPSSPFRQMEDLGLEHFQN